MMETLEPESPLYMGCSCCTKRASGICEHRNASGHGTSEIARWNTQYLLRVCVSCLMVLAHVQAAWRAWGRC